MRYNFKEMYDSKTAVLHLKMIFSHIIIVAEELVDGLIG